jgi:hypothetical protein
MSKKKWRIYVLLVLLRRLSDGCRKIPKCENLTQKLDWSLTGLSDSADCWQRNGPDWLKT